VKCKHFKIFELVPKSLYNGFEEYKLWWLFDDRALWTLDALRDQYGKMIVNDWYFGGIYQERGFRLGGSLTGALMSQHKYGRAFDCKFLDAPVGVVRQDCIEGKYDCFDRITAIELGVSWFHFDLRNSDSDKLLTFLA
jgi:hypothetical protein